MIVDVEVLADRWEEEQKLIKEFLSNDEENWCHYSGMPSPKAYEEEEILIKKKNDEK